MPLLFCWSGICDWWLVTRIATCQLLDLVRREKCEVRSGGKGHIHIAAQFTII